MAWLGDLFAGGRIVDAILVLVAAEALLVSSRPGLFGPRAPLLAGLAAGAGLMLAVRAALSGAPWPWIAAALGLAFAGHLGEIALRRAEALRRREPIATSVHGPALAADIRSTDEDRDRSATVQDVAWVPSPVRERDRVRVENSQDEAGQEPRYRRDPSGAFSSLTPALSRTGEGARRGSRAPAEGGPPPSAMGRATGSSIL